MSTAIDPEVMPPTSVALDIPKDTTSLVADASRFEIAANEFTVDSEAAFQVADQTQASLKAEAKAINEKRLEFTRPIDGLKKKWLDWFSPAIDGRTKAATIYQQKMSAYRKVKREEAEEAQRRADALLAQQKAEQEAEARRLEEKAAKLKTPAAQQRVLAEAENIRTVAALTPSSVAVSASAPQTVASNVAELWELERVESMPEFLRWLAEHPEWHSVISFKTGEMNRMAKQFRNVVPVPGLKFHSKDSFRTKAR